MKTLWSEHQRQGEIIPHAFDVNHAKRGKEAEQGKYKQPWGWLIL